NCHQCLVLSSHEYEGFPTVIEAKYEGVLMKLGLILALAIPLISHQSRPASLLVSAAGSDR
ncbi:MAG: hypothetical protein LUQ22_06395, partial [Methanotrichaceae archaeon]|nr:hypothetical protein [Methanotrichaceae archaeon]